MRYFDRHAALLDAPFGFAAGDVNLRRYVGNNASNGVDPSGLEDPKLTDDELRKRITPDPASKKSFDKLGKDQQEKMLKALLDPKGENAEFIRNTLGVLKAADFGKSWMLIGPADAHHPANIDLEKRVVSYNCASNVLQRFGATTVKIDGKDTDLFQVGNLWPAEFVNTTVAADDVPEKLKVWDEFLNSPFEKGRFKRVEWKPDLKSFDDAKASKLPELDKDKNYVILMAHVGRGAVLFSHVFTNAEKHEWWVSKAGVGPTVLHKSPTALVGETAKRDGNYGVIVAIWEEVPPKKK